MSDLRVSYAAFDDSGDFASQQMQMASVRVRGVDDPRDQERIFAENKQTITIFFQFCDNQHRLAGRAHSHFRMQRGDLEYQYVNNTGQPVVFVTPPTRVPVPGVDNVVIQERLDEPLLPPQCVILFSDGGDQRRLTFSRSGNVVDVSDPDNSVCVYFSDDDVPELVADLVQADEVEFQGNLRFLEGDVQLRRANAADGPVFRGWAVGYMQYSNAAFSGGVEQRFAFEEGLVTYPYPVPFYTVDFTVQCDGTSNQFEFRDEATVIPDYPLPRSTFPLIGEYRQDSSNVRCGVLFFPNAARKAHNIATGAVENYISGAVARTTLQSTTITNYWIKQEETWVGGDGEEYEVNWVDTFHGLDTLTSQTLDTRVQLYTIGRAYNNTFIPPQMLTGEMPFPDPATFTPPDIAGLLWIAPQSFVTFFESWLDAGRVAAFGTDTASELPWVDFKERDISGPSDNGYAHVPVDNVQFRMAAASIPAAPDAFFYTADSMNYRLDLYGLEWGNPSLRDSPV